MEKTKVAVKKKTPALKKKQELAKVKSTAVAPVKIDPLLSVYQSVLDEVDSALKLTTVGFSTERLSTGVLTVDMALGGGLSYGGMVSFSGMEGSAKSTMVMSILRSALRSVPVIDYADAENAVDPDYTSNILGIDSLTDVFGKKSTDGKTWEILPRARYSTDDVAENFFDKMLMQLNRLPDKIYRAENDQWYYVIANTNKKLSAYAKTLGPADKKLSKGGKSWYPTENRGLQALFIADSWPSFTTEAEDEKEDSSNAMALMARVFSKHLPRVRGKLRRKCAMIVGVNQLRERPGTMFGSPLYEPCGQALRFNSSNRNQLDALSVPAEWRHDSKVGLFSEEPSVESGGVDQYQYKRLKNTKNKNGTPFGQAWFRVWIKDSKGKGRGIDPVWDCAQFLIGLKLAVRFSSKEYGKNALEFVESDVAKQASFPLVGMTLTWSEFKLLITYEVYKTHSLAKARKEILKQLGLKALSLQKWCFNLISSGKASKLKALSERLSVKANNDEFDDDDDEEDDDD